MIRDDFLYLVYQKDFSEKGMDRFFIYNGDEFLEVSSDDIISIDCYLVTHDFWLIASSLYKSHNKLPERVIDVVLLSKIVAGKKSLQGDIQPWDISQTIKPLYVNEEDFLSYSEMFYRREELSFDSYMLFSHKLSEYFDDLIKHAEKAGEIERFYNLELPIFNILTLAVCRGIHVNNDVLRKHKDNLKLEFYRELKFFAEKHNVFYELPDKNIIRDKLSDLGYEVEDYSLDFIINFLSSRDGYTSDLRSLRKTNKNYRIFNSISYSSNRLTPVVETFWTSTSRIYYKSPSLQSISKKYRDIFAPDIGMNLCYVDYDQFEVGVMAELSADPKMMEIYQMVMLIKTLLLVFLTMRK